MDSLSKRYLPFEMEGLTPEMVRKAEEELGETPEVRQEALKELRALIKGERDFHPLQDESFLLRFLRSRKMDPEKAFAALRNFYTFKVKYSRIFTDFVPSDMRKVIDMNCLDVLPYRDKSGSPIGVLRIETFDASAATVEDMVSTMLMGVEYGLRMESNQVCGGVLILDMKGLGLKLVRQTATPRFVLRIIRAAQECLAARVKAFHVVNEPFYFTVTFNLFKKFLSEKLKSRFQFHGTNLKSLHEKIPAEILPDELGGSLGPMDNRAMARKLLDLEPHFVRINRYGFQEKRAQLIRKRSSRAFGLFL